jgi:predicted PurR-regulated permease PerM
LSRPRSQITPVWRRPITVGFALVAGCIVTLLVLIYRPVIKPILWASALATLVYPAHRRLLDAVGGRVTLAAVLGTVFWLAVLIAPAILAMRQAIHEAQDLWARLVGALGSDAVARAAVAVEQSPLRGVAHVVMGLPSDADAAAVEQRFKFGVDALGSYVLNSAREFTLGAPAAFVQISITVVTFFFFLRQGPGWVRRLREALPLEPADAKALIDTVALTINAVFRGVLLTAASQATLAAAGYAVAGAPVPLLLGFVTLITALLPFVGAAAVWLPTALGLYWTGHTGAAIGLALWGVAVVSLVDNFLRPYLIGRQAALPLLWMFLAIVGGLQAFGFLGLLLGPAVLALSLACWRIYTQRRARTVVFEPPRTPAEQRDRLDDIR